MRALTIGVIAAIAGFAVAQLHAAATGEPALVPAPASIDRTTDRVVERGLDAQATRAMIRSTIQSELQPRREPAPEPAPPPTHEQIDARRAAESLLAGAIARGHWREEDRDAFALASRGLAEADRVELVRPFVLAVNEQRVQFDYAGPAF